MPGKAKDEPHSNSKERQQPFVLEMRNITKEFPGVKALDRVNLSVRRGEIHALCGENGAGKSTLMKILSGIYPAGSFAGEIRIEGVPRSFKSIRDSQIAGIAIVFQELSLLRELTVGENIFLGREPSRFGIVKWEEVYENTERLLSSLGLQVDPRELVKNLSIGQQQLVEIAKALSLDAKILILDEPTSALSEQEIDLFLRLLQTLKKRGVASVLISHKLKEIFAVSDHITVFRDGRMISTFDAQSVPESQLIADMVGRELKELYPKRHAPAHKGEIILCVEDLTVDHPSKPGRKILEDVSFSIRAGEILGIAGLMGSGRSELLLSLFGAYQGKSRGHIYFRGKQVDFVSPSDAIESGFALVSEDRKRLGLILDESISRNITLSSLSRLSSFGIVNAAEESEATSRLIKELQIKAPSSRSLVKNLSGGNQQKVVLSKWMLTSPRILFLDEPTRGIDVGARSEIYNIMNRLVAQGVAIVMVSSELPEVLGMSDRVIVMCSGRITGEFERAQATQEIIMSYATKFHSAAMEVSCPI